MSKRLLRMLNVMFCTALLSILLPALTVQAAPGDLINVALANNLNVTFSRENPPSETAVKLFDNSSGTKWLAAQTTNVWVQLQFKFGDTQAVPKYAMVSANDAPTRDPRNWRVEGSNDGLNWDVLDERSNQTFSARFQTKEYMIAEDKVKDYAYYRLFILNNNGESTNTQLADWKLYAVELDDDASVDSAVAALQLGDTTALIQGLALPVNFRKGTSVNWVSSNPSVMNNNGKIVKRPELGQPNAQLTLTATVNKGAAVQTKPFNVTVLALSAADFQYEAGIDFESGFESGDIAPTDTTGPDNTYRLLSMTRNVGQFCCSIGGMESKKGNGAHNGAGALQFSGSALNRDESYAYNQIFDDEIVVRPSTTLSYWLFPEKETDVLPTLVRTTSKYTALDILFTDGTYLHDLGAKDQHEVTLHPNAQGNGGFVIEDQWNFISSNIGAVANGKIIDKILFGFDSSGADTGYFRGTVDDITIEHDSTAGEANTQSVNAAKAALSLGDTSAVSGDMNLPAAGELQTTISWMSSNPLMVSHAGKLGARPIPGEPSAEVILTATIRKGDSIAAKTFAVHVLPITHADAAALAEAELHLGDTSAAADDLALPAAGKYGTTITWASSHPAIIDGTGDVNRPAAGQPDAIVTLTATIISGAESLTKPFTVIVVAEGDKGDVAADRAQLDLGEISQVTSSLYLPDFGQHGSRIAWASSNPAVISVTGDVYRPGTGQLDAAVQLTASLTKGAESDTKSFTVNVKAKSVDEEMVLSAAEALDLGNTRAVTNHLALPISIAGMPNVVLTWASSDPMVVDFQGRVERPCLGEPNVTVALTAKISSGTASVTRTFNVTVIALGESEEPLGDDATLSGITIDGNPLSGFDKDTLNYTVELPEDAAQVPVVRAAAADSNADVEITPAANLPGNTVIVVTAEDQMTQQTYTVHFTLAGAPIKDTAKLEGAARVTTGASFDLTYGLSSVSQSVYAQDISFTYDPDKVEFISVDSLRDDFVIADKKLTSGQIRILAVSIGSGLNAGSDLLRLQWNAKLLAESSAATITISNLVISDGEGTETEVEGTSHHIQINAVVKAALQALIAEAQEVHDAAVEGTQSGQYPAGTKALLQTAIQAAGQIAGSPTATQTQVDQGAAQLSAALQAFRASVITRLPDDLNGDDKYSIGDLGMMAAYYGKTSEDPNWDLYKKADLVQDGIIDIADLAALARKILG
ncbi:immunoglobulin-like domain-containing protein [Paenibacillus sp. EPM92]|uniref:immunoglobulin-like domain-containing protein n=1 Tax=Paenibacillus sp. EPM92 TaxID=1561195 RepID=UPI0019168AB3|nr:immunoglobulin-like domain-containing protein [Paenibacillus sp. EPM92]